MSPDRYWKAACDDCTIYDTPPMYREDGRRSRSAKQYMGDEESYHPEAHHPCGVAHSENTPLQSVGDVRHDTSHENYSGAAQPSFAGQDSPVSSGHELLF